MENKEVVHKVLEKLAASLSKEVRKEISILCNDLKKSDSSEYLKKIVSFKNNFNLTDAQYAEALEIIVDAKVFMGEDGKTRDPDKVKHLKSITDHPPVRVFFNRTY